MSFVHTPHPRTLLHRTPVKTTDMLPKGSAYSRFGSFLAVKVVAGVGSMTCAYLFCILALLGLPQALSRGGEGPIAWIAQTFIQLVLLSIIIVGTNIQSAASDVRATHTYEDSEAILAECLEMQRHLQSQDGILDGLVAKLGDASPGATLGKAVEGG